MLPGFRFLFAAIVLSVSVLIFGLGAAALLRAAHEQFASVPSRRPLPEPVFTQQNEPPPTLALLRVEPVVTESVPEVVEKVQDNVAATAIPEAVTPPAPVPEAEREKPATAEPEKLASLNTEPAPGAPAKVDIPAAETTTAEPPIAVEDVKVAVEAPRPMTAAVEPETPSLASNPAALKIATLGGPAVTIEQPQPAAAKTTSAKPRDRSVNRKRAQRAKERRRSAATRRARQAATQQQPADPFAPTPPARARP